MTNFGFNLDRPYNNDDGGDGRLGREGEEDEPPITAGPLAPLYPTPWPTESQAARGS